MVASGLGKKSRGPFTIVAISYYFLPSGKEQPFTFSHEFELHYLILTVHKVALRFTFFNGQNFEQDSILTGKKSRQQKYVNSPSSFR